MKTQSQEVLQHLKKVKPLPVGRQSRFTEQPVWLRLFTTCVRMVMSSLQQCNMTASPARNGLNIVTLKVPNYDQRTGEKDFG